MVHVIDPVAGSCASHIIHAPSCEGTQGQGQRHRRARAPMGRGSGTVVRGDPGATGTVVRGDPVATGTVVRGDPGATGTVVRGDRGATGTGVQGDPRAMSLELGWPETDSSLLLRLGCILLSSKILINQPHKWGHGVRVPSHKRTTVILHLFGFY